MKKHISELRDSWMKLWNKWKDYYQPDEKGPTNEFGKFIDSALVFLERKPKWPFVFGFLSITSVFIQILILIYQTSIFDLQSSFLEKDNHYTTFENASRFQKLLEGNPEHTQKSHNIYAVSVLENLAKNEKKEVIDATLPLLQDGRPWILNGTFNLLLSIEPNLSELFENAKVFLADSNFHSIHLSNKSIDGLKLEKCLFEDALLEDTSITDSILIESKFTNSTLNDVTFERTILQRASFKNTKMHNVTYTNLKLLRVNFTDTRSGNANFSGLTITSSFFNNAELPKIDFRNSELNSCYFVNAKMKSAKFQGATLTFCDFENADLSLSRFEKETKLVQNDFVNANLSSATFLKVHLSNTDLSGANLKGADMTDASFSGKGTKFKLANFSNCNIKGLTGWENMNFKNANIYRVDNAPAGFVEHALSTGAVQMPSAEWDKFKKEQAAK